MHILVAFGWKLQVTELIGPLRVDPESEANPEVLICHICIITVVRMHKQSFDRVATEGSYIFECCY